MKIKVKNILDKDKSIELCTGEKYLLKLNEEKIIGDYDDKYRPLIFSLLQKGLEVSKINNEDVKDFMLINMTSSMTLDESSKDININTHTEQTPPKKRGRPSKKKVD